MTASGGRRQGPSSSRIALLRTLLATVMVAAGLGAVAGNAISQSGGTGGFAGDDDKNVEKGTASADLMSGGGGADFFRGGAASDELYGDEGQDALIGDETAGATACCADYLNGGADSDEIVGGSGADTEIGGEGDDFLGSSDMTAIGGVYSPDYGNDDIDAGAGEDYVDAGPGEDEIVPGVGHDVVIAGAINEVEPDTVIEGPGSDTIDGGGGFTDRVDYGGLSSPIEVVARGDGSGYTAFDYKNQEETVLDEDRLYRIEQVIGTDVAEGDNLAGHSGEDGFDGEGGSDVISGEGGNDTLRGGDDNDTVSPGAGDDDAWGDGGSDTVSYRGSSTGVVASLHSMTATGAGTDNIQGFEKLHGSRHNDQLTGTDGDNFIDGYTGAFPSAGQDQLFGRDGADQLWVRDGAGGDTVDCGAGLGDVADVDPSDTVSGGCEAVRDLVTPSAPGGLTLSPSSPADDSLPELSGVISGGAAAARVLVFLNSSCSGSPVATGTPEQFGGAGIPIPVPENSTSTITALGVDAGGESSPCSEPVTYTERASAPTPTPPPTQSTPPSAPRLTGTSPKSPSSHNRPRLLGRAGAGLTIRIYKTAKCTGAPVASGTAAALARPGLRVFVKNNTRTAFRAVAFNADGRRSACSAPIRYRERSRRR